MDLERIVCCNWDCDFYPTTPKKCFNETFKCRWFVIAAKVKGYNYDKRNNLFVNEVKKRTPTSCE
jgi:hypothetical protein